MLHLFITWHLLDQKRSRPGTVAYAAAAGSLMTPKKSSLMVPTQNCQNQKTNVQTLKKDSSRKKYPTVSCMVESVHTISVASTLVPIIFSLTSHSFWILTCRKTLVRLKIGETQRRKQETGKRNTLIHQMSCS